MTGSTATRSVRDRLIDAAEVCLRAKGIRATTVSEVAEVAGVSRGWLYRHFPDKVSLLGAAIVRLNEVYWSESHAMLERVEGLDQQIVEGIRHGRSAYDDPGALLMKLRIGRAGGVRGVCRRGRGRDWCPISPTSGSDISSRRVERGEIHPDTDIPQASEWVARVLLSLTTVPGDTLDPRDPAQVLSYVRRYVMPGLRADPAG